MAMIEGINKQQKRSLLQVILIRIRSSQRLRNIAEIRFVSETTSQFNCCCVTDLTDYFSSTAKESLYTN